MRKQLIVLIMLAAVSLTSDLLAQEQLMKVKGGHQLGETADRFFAEGNATEREVGFEEKYGKVLRVPA
jgi:hypothetical protein